MGGLVEDDALSVRGPNFNFAIFGGAPGAARTIADRCSCRSFQVSQNSLKLDGLISDRDLMADLARLSSPLQSTGHRILLFSLLFLHDLPFLDSFLVHSFSVDVSISKFGP